MKAPDSQTIRRALYVAVAVAFSTLVFFEFGKGLGDAAALVSVVPVALVAAFFGSRAGLVATALAFPFNTFLLDYLSGVRNDNGAVTQTRALITLSLVIVSLAFGRYHVLAKKVQQLEDADRASEGSAIRSEERLRTLLSAVPDAIARLSRGGRVLEIHGETGLLDRSDYLYRNLSDFLPAEFATALVDGIQRALESGKVQVVSGNADLGGTERSYEVRISPDGLEAVATARDITAQRRADQREKHGNAVSTHDSFVAAIAHELRTPLSAVIGFSQELRDHGGTFSEAERTEIIDTIASQAGILRYRIEDLIAAARADVGLIEVAKGRFDLNHLTREVVASLPDNQVRVIGETTIAEADRFRTVQVIRNLVDNAVTHGGGEVFVTVESTTSGVQVGVHDDGPGVGLENPAEVFEPYRTDAEAETQPDRLGLGLVVARQLARLMDGDVTYERRNGLSSFVFSLPKAT
jgi:signal transduction histidine kinase